MDEQQASRLAPLFRTASRLSEPDQPDAVPQPNVLCKPVWPDLPDGLGPNAAGRPEILSEKAYVPDYQPGAAPFHGYSIFGLGRCFCLDFFESSAT
jgi:hypothetical protein